MPKKILVTGGCGFIGTNFVKYLLRNEDYEISVFDKLTYAANLNNLKKENVKIIKGDLAKRNDIYRALRDIDIVVNFAAETHVDRSIINADDFIKTNINGVYNILSYMKESGNVDKFVHISTDEVYGNALFRKLDEESSLKPNNPYSATKASADLLVSSYFKTYNIPAVITRSSNNYGPFQHPEKLIPKTIIYSLLNRKIPMYGNGRNKRNWLYVEDNVLAILMVMKKGTVGEIYNIGSETELENIEIIGKILKMVNKSKDLIINVNDRPGNDLRYSMDFSKIVKLGFKPEVDIDSGLQKTIEWYKSNKDLWTNYLLGIDFYDRF